MLRLSLWRRALCRLADAFTIPKGCYEVQTCRGGGPGGSAANASSNKVELRLDLTKLHVECAEIDQDLLTQLRSKFAAHVSKDDLLIVTSHAHRSAQKNEEECVNKVTEMLREAATVPDAPPPPLQHNPAVLRGAIDKRRLQSNKNRAVLSAKRGKLSGSSW